MAKSKLIIWTIAIIFIVLLVLTLIGVMLNILIPDQSLCTQEVMECSDGSFVSRNGMNDCQFDSCPESGGSGLFE